MQPPCNLCALLYDETPHQDAQSITSVPMSLGVKQNIVQVLNMVRYEIHRHLTEQQKHFPTSLAGFLTPPNFWRIGKLYFTLR